MEKTKVIKIDNEEYYINRTRPFSTGYGTAGSRGLRIIRKRDNYSMGHYQTIAEFRKDRAYFKKLRKRNK